MKDSLQEHIKLRLERGGIVKALLTQQFQGTRTVAACTQQDFKGTISPPAPTPFPSLSPTINASLTVAP